MTSASAAGPAPLPGTLHVYDPSKRLTFFESGSFSTGNSLIFVGGLGDGLAAIPSLPLLSDALAERGWSLIQVLTGSSYSGWGMGSVDRDAEDLQSLETYLRSAQGGKGKGKLVLMGHSTGCQDIIRFCQLYSDSTYDGFILQAPVSDREHAEAQMDPSDLSTTITACEEQMKAGKGAYPPTLEITSLMSSGDTPDAISAQRWHSLNAKGGHEDYFSSDLSDEYMEKAFDGIKKAGKRCMFLMGEKDECVPNHVDKEKLLSRFKEHAGEKAEGIVLRGATHSVEDEGVMKDFMGVITKFLENL